MSSASSAPPAPAKSILIQVYRCVNHTEETNSWYIIRETKYGPKISEIFGDLPQDEPIHSRKVTNCVFLGSHLYDIGGGDTDFHYYNRIRRLDTENLDAGWKSEELPFYCSDLVTAVSGNFIYMLPRSHISIKTPKQIQDPKSPAPWAYMYDTIEHKASPLNLPDNLNVFQLDFCLPLEGHRVLVPVTDRFERGRRGGEIDFYVHDNVQSKWRPIGSKKMHQGNRCWYVALNGVLYVFHIGWLRFLNAYSISPWEHLGETRLPHFDNLFMDMDNGYADLFIVSVADSEFCLLWHYGGGGPLHYAKISVSVDSLQVILLSQIKLDINAENIINCLPWLGPNLFSDDQEEEDGEVDWKKRCMDMEEELRSLRAQLREYIHSTKMPHKRSRNDA